MNLCYIFVLLTAVFVSNCVGQGLQCSIPYVTINSSDPNDLVFSNFPASQESPFEPYEPGSFGAWYDIAGGVIRAVRPGSVTEEVIVPIIETSNINFSNPSTVQLSNQQLEEFGRDLATWWAGIIALTIIGGLLGISFLVCCCCFCICRCCKKCGGDLKQEESKNTNCLTITFTIILVVCVCALIAGVVLAFFSNQQVFDSVTRFEETVDDTFTQARNFIDDTLEQVDILLCQVNDTLDITVDEARGLLGQVNRLLDDFSTDVYNTIDLTIATSTNITTLNGTLTSISNSVADVRASTNSINMTLNNIAADVQALRTSCDGSAVPASTCENIDPSVYSQGLGVDYSQVPDIDNEINNVANTLNGIDLAQVARDGNDTFNSARNDISNLVNNVDTEIQNGLSNLRGIIVNASDTLGGFNSSAQADYIDVGMDYVDTGFTFVRQYDTPRYAIGIVISCSAAIVVIIVILGIVCGMLGFRTDRAPYERTDLSNCGGIILLCGAIVGFIIGCLLFILSALAFFGGSAILKFCDDAAGPEYVIFAQTADNPSLNNNQYILSELLYQNGSIDLTISGILRECGSNTSTVYGALRLENLEFISQLNDFTNISQFVPDVSGNVDDLSNQISGVFNQSTFVPSDVQARLTDFTDDGVDNINITAYTEQINSNILLFNITNQIEQLEMTRDAFTMAGQTALATSTQNIIDQLNTLEGEVAAASAEVNTLSGFVDDLQENGESLTTGTNNLLGTIDSTVAALNSSVNSLVTNVSNVFPRAIGFAQQFVDFSIGAFQTQVANCYPIYSVYTGFHDSFCGFTLDGLNGFWLSLGTCGFFLIFVIVFSIVTSQYYRRMRYEEDGGLPYEDSFPLKTY